MIIVFDSGVWISAIRFDGTPEAAIIHAMMQDRIVVCAEIEDEIIRTMHRKFNVPEWEIRGQMIPSLENCIYVTLTGDLTGICRDPKDDFILECAVKGHADLIVTGDKDLLSLGSFEGVAILTPRQYLDHELT